METKMTSSKFKPLPVPDAVDNVEDGKRCLDEYGMFLHRNVLSPDEVAQLADRLVEQAELEREQDVALISDQSYSGKTWYGGADGKLPAWQGVMNLPNKGRVFMDLLYKNKLMHEYCAHAFRGVPGQIAASNGLIQRKGCEPMTVHCDTQWLPFVPTGAPPILNVFFCLSDFEEDMGATRVVPGSHRVPPPEVKYIEGVGNVAGAEYETLPVICKAGDMFGMESRLWHQSGASSSDKVRLCATVVWSQFWLKPINLFPQTLHDEVYASLSPEELELLGFKCDAAGIFEPRYPGDRQTTNRPEPYIPELRRGGQKRAVPAPRPRTHMDQFKIAK
jgi:hypothetical protein